MKVKVRRDLVQKDIYIPLVMRNRNTVFMGARAEQHTIFELVDDRLSKKSHLDGRIVYKGRKYYVYKKDFEKHE